MTKKPKQPTELDAPAIEARNSWKWHRLWFTRLSRAARDMDLAAKHGLYAIAIPDRDDDARYAHTLALVVLYARPFSMTKGFRAHADSMKIEADALPYTEDERATHKHLMRARNEWWAHTDAEHFEALPLVGEGEHPDATVHIEHRLTFFLDDEIRQIIAMSEKAKAYFAAQRQDHRTFLQSIGDVAMGPPYRQG